MQECSLNTFKLFHSPSSLLPLANEGQFVSRFTCIHKLWLIIWCDSWARRALFAGFLCLVHLTSVQRVLWVIPCWKCSHFDPGIWLAAPTPSSIPGKLPSIFSGFPVIFWHQSKHLGRKRQLCKVSCLRKQHDDREPRTLIICLPEAVWSNGLQKSHPGTLVPGGNSTQCMGLASPLLSGLRALAALKHVWLHVQRSNTLTINYTKKDFLMHLGSTAQSWSMSTKDRDLWLASTPEVRDSWTHCKNW